VSAVTRRYLGIVGSPRPGSSSELLVSEALGAVVSEDAKADLVFLRDLDIRFCRGCLACVFGGGCPQRDDVPWLYEIAAACDGFILAAPVHFGGVPAALKTLIDRGVSRFPRFKTLRLRPAATILVTGRRPESQPGAGTRTTDQHLAPAPNGPERIAGAALAEAAILLGGRLVGSLTAATSGPGDLLDEAEAVGRARELGLALALDRPLPPEAGLCPVCGLPLAESAGGQCPFCLRDPSRPESGRFTPQALTRHHDEWMQKTRDRFLAHLAPVRDALAAMGESTFRRLRPPRS